MAASSTAPRGEHDGPGCVGCLLLVVDVLILLGFVAGWITRNS